MIFSCYLLPIFLSKKDVGNDDVLFNQYHQQEKNSIEKCYNGHKKSNKKNLGPLVSLVVLLCKV